RNPIRRHDYARPRLDGAAPRRSVRADGLVKPVFLGGTDRPAGRRGNRSGLSQPELKATPVRVSALTICWRGFLLRRSDIALAGEFYWARVPLQRGHAFDLAGWEPLPSDTISQQWILGFFGDQPGSELIVHADPGRGAFRYARLVEGLLEACLFLARDGAFLPSREHLTEMLGEGVDRRARLTMLAGTPPGALSRIEPGAIVCACFSVGLNTLHSAIAEGALTTVARLG